MNTVLFNRRFLFILLLVTAFSASAVEFHVVKYDYFLDLPAGWTVFDAEDKASISFVSHDNGAMFQVMTFPGETYLSAEAMLMDIPQSFGAEGDSSPFMFMEDDAVLADMTFKVGEYDSRGYLVFINREDYDFYLLAFAPLENYEVNHDILLSCIDSFSIKEEGRFHPGPISCFYYPFPGPNTEPQVINFNGHTFSIDIDPATFEASQVVIEREAQIQVNYPPELWYEGWYRYYRMVFRDNYSRLDQVYEKLAEILNNKENLEIVKELLKWVQHYRYYRPGTLSDLLSPIESICIGAGDCDGKGVILNILLDRFGIDAILLVSNEYAHSVTGIDIQAQGARFPFEGKQYLLAETNNKIEIGLIAQQMSDIDKWVPIRLGKN